MCCWIVPVGGSLGGGIALLALNFVIGGVIGGFVLVWRLIVAVWYVPLTIYRLIAG
jgi:lipid-binding SYLF domain-containing protein